MSHQSTAPFFSIVIPCYNQQPFLPETIASVAAQQFTDLEVIIVNDGSSDASSQTARELIRHHTHLPISLLEQENMGVAAARNTGIAKARGQWIVALDGDDQLAGGFLSAVAEATRHYPEANAFTGAYSEFGARSSEWRLTRFVPERLKERGNIVCCAPFRRFLWEAVDGYDSSLPWGGEDWHFWLKCLSADLRFVSLPVPMLHYRIHSGDSRFSTMCRHADDTLAMVKCLIPELYPRQELYEAHKRLMHMEQATEDALQQKTSRHPALPLPLFWLGLAHEGRNDKQAARCYYEAALRHAWPGTWQAELRLAGLGAGQ